MCNAELGRGSDIHDASKWCSKAVDEALHIVEQLPQNYYIDDGNE